MGKVRDVQLRAAVAKAREFAKMADDWIAASTGEVTPTRRWTVWTRCRAAVNAFQKAGRLARVANDPQLESEMRDGVLRYNPDNEQSVFCRRFGVEPVVAPGS